MKKMNKFLISYNENKLRKNQEKISKLEKQDMQFSLCSNIDKIKHRYDEAYTKDKSIQNIENKLTKLYRQNEKLNEKLNNY